MALFKGKFSMMVLTTKYLPFWTRVRKEVLAGLLIVVIFSLYSYFKEGNVLGLSGLMILGFGVIFLTISLIKAKTFVSEVKITEDQITVTGHDFDSRWDKEMDIKTSDIKIKSKGRGSSVDYFFIIESKDQTVVINRSFNWDYLSLLAIFREFKRIKGEKIIFDEKYFLDIMEKKANGFSAWDIASGKEMKK